MSYSDTVSYAAEGVIFITGAAVQWLRDCLEIISMADQTEAMATSVPDTQGVYFIPSFVGLAAPYWNYKTRGTIVGLTRGVKEEHIVRATLEYTAYQARDVIKVMQKETGTTIRELKVDGGAVKNSFLMQFQADILDLPIVVPKVTETTCLGAAYLAGLNIGFWKDIGEIESIWEAHKVYRPAMEKSRRDALCAGWQRSVRGSMNIYD
jgi:glycerol kinase